MPEPASQARWARVKDVFRSALTLATADRGAFVASACGDDADLRRDVESLLGALDGAGTLEGQAADKLGGEATADPLIGRRVGAYRVLAEIGQGGMGAVYCAIRDDDVFRKNVALKVMRVGLTTAFHRESFHQERQILASLQHPNVAQLLDGGTTDDGRPYLVMELVAGEPIDVYCEHRALGVRERLELFRQVCAAVQCAHQSLVVHRDLKPANILVTAEGIPKLLDFGIAKLLPAQGGEATVTQVRALTPLYASPEQLLGQPITTASDVYSLGVVLYELLAGRRPFDAADGMPEELVRRICQEEPVRPSTAARSQRAPVTTSAPTQTLVGGAPTEVSPSTAPVEHRARSRDLRGDLDVIVMTALAKEPQRRYGSPAALSEDLRRHLEGRPIAARRPTLAYRTRKFARRHPGGLAAAALVLALLGAFAFSTLRQSARVARERDKAERVAQFMIELFQVSDPGEGRGNSVTAREMLDKGAARITRELANQPDVRATLLVTMGNVYQGLGLYDRAIELLTEAVRVRRETLGPRHGDTARALADLGAAYVWAGDYPRAEAALTEALTIQVATAGPGLADRGQTLHFLGAAYYAHGDYDAAQRSFSEALAARRAALGPRDGKVGLTLNNLGNVMYEKGDYDQAARLYGEALAIVRAVRGDEHPSVAVAVHNLAGVLAAKGDYAGAVARHRESVALRTRTLGPDHPVLAGNKVSLALALLGQGDAAAAEPLLREALEVQRRRLGPEHEETVYTLEALGEVRTAVGDYVQAEALFREALRSQRKAGNLPDVCASLTGLGTVLDQRGDRAGALLAQREALASRREQFGDTHIYVSLTLAALGATLRHGDDFAASESAYREAVAIDRKLGSEHPNLVVSLAGLAAALRSLGRGAEAEPLAREAVGLAARIYPQGEPRRAVAESVLGGCLADARRYDEAIALLEPAHAALRVVPGPHSLEAQEARRLLAELYVARGQPGKLADLR